MQNSTWLWVVGVVVVVAIGVYILMQGSAPGTPAPGSTSTAQTSGGTGGSSSQSTSLNALISSGVAQKCTFSSENASAASSGTIYLAPGLMRGDFTSTSGGQTAVSHMIVKDNTNYVWSSAMSQGVKMSFNPAASGGTTQGGVDVNAQTNYSCAPWSVDESFFQLPADVTFMAIGQATP